MRRFLYYDEDSINSFLAQIEKGLLTKKGKEKEITDTVSSQLDTTADITGDLSAKVIGIGASLKEISKQPIQIQKQLQNWSKMFRKKYCMTMLSIKYLSI